MDLMKRGIESDLIEKYIDDDLLEFELNSAIILAQKKARTSDTDKIKRFLLNKGYSHSISGIINLFKLFFSVKSLFSLSDSSLVNISSF